MATNNKINRMGLSIDVDDEINFKAVCDVLNGKKSVPSKIEGTHSDVLVDFMKKYFRKSYKQLTPQQKIDFDNIKAQYIANKLNSGII